MRRPYAWLYRGRRELPNKSSQDARVAGFVDLFVDAGVGSAVADGFTGTVALLSVRPWIWRWMAAGFNSAYVAATMILSWAVPPSWSVARRCGVVAAIAAARSRSAGPVRSPSPASRRSKRWPRTSARVGPARRRSGRARRRGTSTSTGSVGAAACPPARAASRNTRSRRR